MKTGKVSNLRTFRRRAGRILSLPPLPEEQLGMIGFDNPSEKDHLKQAREGQLLPIDLRKKYPVPIRNQYRSNRCGGFAGSGFLSLLSQKLWINAGGESDNWFFSANEIYWHARRDKSVDGGVYMRDLMDALHKKGSFSEEIWPSEYPFLVRPKSLPATTSEARTKIKGYERVSLADLDWKDNLRRVFSVEELPVLYGLQLFDKSTDEANRTGYYTTHNKGRQTSLGGHALYAVGWLVSNGKLWMLTPNSWGSKVGIGGVWLVDFDEVSEGHIRDLWTVPLNYY